jgi:circadian clock protein KaiC
MAKSSANDRVPTGVTQLDKMLHGGIMRGDVTLVVGSPGTGKTTLGTHFLYNGAKKYNEPGLMVTFEELPRQIYRDALNMGMDLKKLEAKKKLKILCTTPSVLQKMKGKSNYLDELINELKVKRVFVDSLSLFEKMLQFQVSSTVYFTTHTQFEEIKLREELYSFINYFKTRMLTTMMSYELPSVIDPELKISEYGVGFLVDSIIVLREVEVESKLAKAVAILKTRGSDHDPTIREMKITEKGLQIGLPFKGYTGIIARSAEKIL